MHLRPVSYGERLGILFDAKKNRSIPIAPATVAQNSLKFFFICRREMCNRKMHSANGLKLTQKKQWNRHLIDFWGRETGEAQEEKKQKCLRIFMSYRRYGWK